MSSHTANRPNSDHAGHAGGVKKQPAPYAHPLHPNLPRRATMVKPRVGVAKVSTRDLPVQEHVYGYVAPVDVEGAGDLISNWVTADPTIGKEYEQSHVHSNVLAIKNGCTTSKAFRIFTKNHPNLRMKEILTVEQTRSGAKFEGPFGKKSDRSLETVGDLVQGKFTHFENDDPDYPNLEGLVVHSHAVVPRPTKASQGWATIARKKAEENRPELDNFVMKKFQNVPGKLNLPPRSSRGDHPATDSR